MVHLQHAHKNIYILNGEDIVFLATEINLEGAVDWVMIQSCFGHHFVLVLEKQESCDGHTQFYAIVQLIGSRKQAEHFAYRSVFFYFIVLLVFSAYLVVFKVLVPMRSMCGGT